MSVSPPPPRPPEPFETWLDFILRDFDEVRGSDCGGNSRDAAREELRQLRQRASDLELMLRAALRGEFCVPFGGAVGRCDWELHPAGSTIYGLKRGPDGLPALTEETRSALRRTP